jgi:hypothetical protein
MLIQRHQTVRQSPVTGHVALSLIRGKQHDWLSSQTNILPNRRKSHDWDARATEVIAEARKMPLGQR